MFLHEIDYRCVVYVQKRMTVSSAVHVDHPIIQPTTHIQIPYRLEQYIKLKNHINFISIIIIRFKATVSN